MTTDVLGSGPFKQPFNKTSSAVRHTGSLMLGNPAENTLPPVSKLSAFGSPRRASIILQGLFKLVGKVLPFFHTVGYVTFRRISLCMKLILFGLSIQISRLRVPISCGGFFDMACVVRGAGCAIPAAHLPVA